MKTLLITAVTWFCANGIAMDQLPNGEFKGYGNWTSSSGDSGSYELTTSINRNTVASVYHFDGQKREWTFEAKFGKGGFFEVLSQGEAIGQGYCRSVQCHYEVSAGPSKVEETLTFVDGKLFRVGSKESKRNHIAWEESLQ